MNRVRFCPSVCCRRHTARCFICKNSFTFILRQENRLASMTAAMHDEVRKTLLTPWARIQSDSQKCFANFDTWWPGSLWIFKVSMLYSVVLVVFWSTFVLLCYARWTSHMNGWLWARWHWPQHKSPCRSSRHWRSVAQCDAVWRSRGSLGDDARYANFKNCRIVSNSIEQCRNFEELLDDGLLLYCK